MDAAQGRVNIRTSHLGLYLTTMVVGLAEVGLAVNFWYSNPAFNPYGISKSLVGNVYFALGLSQLVCLNVLHSFSKVKIALVMSIGGTFVWGIANTDQFFNGPASLQLPIFVLLCCALQAIPLIVEWVADSKRLKELSASITDANFPKE